jgi:biopolymer transport protein ExbD
MVRRPAFHSSRELDLDVTMTPMIDVVFLLLVFFIWTVGFQVVEYVLPSQLSAQIGSQPSTLTDPQPQDDFDSVVIRIVVKSGRADWLVNDQPLADVNQLGQRLAQLAAIKADAPIIVHPDQDVPLGYVIETYDMARMAGFQKVSFAVSSS